jgi:hypothetical protein
MMKMLHLLGKPLYGGVKKKTYSGRSPRETLLYANDGKLFIVSTIPSAGNTGKHDGGARTEVRNEIGSDKCAALLDTIEAAFGVVAIEQMAALVSMHLKQAREKATNAQNP